MVDTVIRAGITYSFYAVPYSLPAITKLDKKIIAIQKKICGLPKCTPNIVTQLPHDMFGIEAFSLKNAYLRSIGEQFRNALNDKGRLGIIYRGLTHFILAKHGGAKNIPRIKHQDCIRSPTTRTLFLIKKTGGAHLRSNIDNFPLQATPLEQMWCLLSTTHLPHINSPQTLKLLHKLLLHNIYEIKHLTLPNGINLMILEDFKKFYSKPTKLIKQALDIAEQLFCHPWCNPTCQTPCDNYHPPHTLKEEYITLDHNIEPRTLETHTQPSTLPHPPQPLPPQNIKNNPIRYPIHSILDHKDIKTKDKYKIIKEYQTFLCQWNLPNNITYNKWIPQRELFPLNLPHVIEHNTSLLVNYYSNKQHIFYRNTINANFTSEQNRDTRYIPPPLVISLAHISINECNPEKDIKIDKCATQNDSANIYEEIGKHLITISIERLKWLWKQYTQSQNRPNGLIPPTQSFETEIVWLYQRYKYRIPKNDPLKHSHHAIPKILLDHITTSFNITHSYFSSPVTCSTLIQKFYSPFSRDKIFGSIGHAYSYKWKEVGYAHPHNEKEAETAIHWVRLTTKNDPNTITILTIPDNKWYQNHTPHIGPFQDTHVIAHIPADTITYEEPTIPIEMNKPRVKSASIHILCVHHNNNNIGNIEQINTLTTILNNLHIPQIYTQIAPPTPPNTQVNKSKKWIALTYPTTNLPQYVQIPLLPNYENNNSLKFPPQYCYYTDGSFLPPQQIGDRWIRKKTGYGVYNQHKNLELAARLPGLQNIFRAE